MASFDIVNYSLRPSKNIQRQIVFNGVRKLQEVLDLDGLAYVGFGSIWFTDFVMAHKLLEVDHMVSIESHDVGFRRALFNAPYATIRVKHGLSSDILPSLLEDNLIKSRPWMVWLDYDYEFNESLRSDIRLLIENAPTNSILLVTFNGHEMKYGQPVDRPTRLRTLFGDVVPDDLSRKSCKDERMQDSLANFSIDYMRSVAAEVARPGGFVPAFRIIYKDSAPMVTVGGILPAKGAARIACDLVDSTTWKCRPQTAVVAPHLTLKEASILQSQLPRMEKLSRTIVQGLGFDLEVEQIDAFEKYYRLYPSFAQIT